MPSHTAVIVSVDYYLMLFSRISVNVIKKRKAYYVCFELIAGSTEFFSNTTTQL